MKYALFAFAFVVGVPLLAGLALASEKLRNALVAALVFSPALGDRGSINFLSLESYRGPDRGFEVTLTDLLALALFLVLLARHLTGLKVWPRFTGAVLLFGLTALVGTALAPEPLLAGFTLFKFARLFFVYWVLVNVLRAGVPFRTVVGALTALGVFFLLVALKQKYLDGIYRIPGPFDHSNTIPLYLNLVAPLVLMASLVERYLPLWRAALGVGAALGMTFAVVATGSRAGLALNGLAVLTVLAFAAWKARSLRVLAVSLGVLVALAVGGAMAADSIIDRLQRAPPASEEARREFNVAASRMAADHPFGVGLNNFSHVLDTRESYRSHFRVMANEKHSGVAHHIYLLTAAELGYVGLAAFVWLIVRFWWFALRRGLRLTEPAHFYLLALAVGMTALHASGFLEWAFRISPVSYQFVFACAFVVHLGSTVLPARGGAPARGSGA